MDSVDPYLLTVLENQLHCEVEAGFKRRQKSSYYIC